MRKTAKQPDGPAKLSVQITAPDFKFMPVTIIGTSPYVQNRFAAKEDIMAAQAAGQQSRSKKKRPPKDFDKNYRNAMHISKQGWHGMPASAFRKAIISACRLVEFRMTLAKLSIFVEADGYDKSDGTPLVRITKGKPEIHIGPVRNANGSMDLRARPMWQEWEAIVMIRFDVAQFSPTDVMNLMNRVGVQVGIGEGRADSREGPGVGWGFFRLKETKQ